MRVSPRRVTRALRRYDPDLSLVWDDRKHWWMARWKGRNVMVLRHADGRLMQSLDGYTDEILRLFKRSDNYVDGPERLKAWDRMEGARKYAVQRHEEQVTADASKEASAVARVVVNGPRPFLPPRIGKAKRERSALQCSRTSRV